MKIKISFPLVSHKMFMPEKNALYAKSTEKPDFELWTVFVAERRKLNFAYVRAWVESNPLPKCSPSLFARAGGGGEIFKLKLSPAQKWQCCFVLAKYVKAREAPKIRICTPTPPVAGVQSVTQELCVFIWPDRKSIAPVRIATSACSPCMPGRICINAFSPFWCARSPLFPGGRVA